MTMDITVSEDKPENLSFTWRNADSAFANALRRIMLSEVPTLAINEVTVKANSSVTTDEMLVHRLGLVPIVSSMAAEMNFPWSCPCEESGLGCSRCTVEAELVAHCTLDESVKQITTKDISVISGPLSQNVFPTHRSGNGIWLTSLGPGQEINLYCKIQKGIAKQHAKWMPVSAVTMQYEAEISTNNEELGKLTLMEKEKFVAVCPRKVFSLSETNNSIFLKNPDDCIFCNDCVSPEGLPANLVRVRPKKTLNGLFTYRFRIETIGSLSPKQVLRQALDILRSKLSVVERSLLEKEPLSYMQKTYLAGDPLVGVGMSDRALSSKNSFAQTEVMSLQLE